MALATITRQTTSLYFPICKKEPISQSGLPCCPYGKEIACNAGDSGSIPGSGRHPGEGNGNPLQYSCLENPRDRGAWWAAIYGVAQSWTRLSPVAAAFFKAQLSHPYMTAGKTIALTK